MPDSQLKDTDLGDRAQLLKVAVYFGPTCYLMLTLLWYFLVTRAAVPSWLFIVMLVVDIPLTVAAVFAIYHGSHKVSTGLVNTIFAAGNIPPPRTYPRQDVMIVRGQYREAADYFRDHLTVEPEDNEARLRLGDLLQKHLADYAAAEQLYLEVRRRYPDAEMMMGVGNLTELTDVDSAGVNVVLAGFCQELGIRSVLTTEVINWCRSSVRELDLARRLFGYACRHRILPKHLEPDLVMLRDPKLREHDQAFLTELAEHISDRNFRLFAEGGLLHVMNDKMHLQGTDPFDLFAQMSQKESIDPSHAFYLGYEMAKAMIALTLGKNYLQDQALRWGFLTKPEQTHQPPREWPPPV